MSGDEFNSGNAEVDGRNQRVSGVVTYFGNETVTTDLYFWVSGLLLELVVQFVCAGRAEVLSDEVLSDVEGGTMGRQLGLAAPLIEVIRLPVAGATTARLVCAA